MRAGNTYRGSKKREARARKLVWRELDMLEDGNGSRVVKYPFEKNHVRLKEESAHAE